VTTEVGINEILVSTLQTTVGVAVTYASKALFQAADWDLTALDEDGVELDPQPTWDLVLSEADGRAQFKVAVVAGGMRMKMTVPTGYYASVTDWTIRGTNYGLDDLGAMIAATNSVTIAATLTTTSATAIDGESIYIPGISITEAALTAIGASSLADCATRVAFIKRNSQDSNDAADVDATDGLTVTATSDTVGARTVKVDCATFPAILGVPDDANVLSCTLQVWLTKGSKQICGAQVTLSILWSADEGEAVDPP
jgi:hypothetical protein